MAAIKILNGPMGTELQRRGYKTTLPLWSGSANLENIELVKQIHRDYVALGAEIITTNTFRTNPRAWAKVDREGEAEIATKDAINAALEIKKENPEILVGISISTLEDCYEPESVPPQEELDKEHSKQVMLFKDSGADFVMIETINTIREAETILRYVKEIGMPAWLSFVTNENGDLLSGESMEDAVAMAKKYDVKVIGVNCRPPEVIIHAARKLSKAFDGEKIIYANGDGQPANDLGWEFFDRCSPEDYLNHAKEWAELGFNIIGSCCGGSPEHVKKLKESL
jgi:S-methylmethionine-dependent homocysteine/selenocysteine methylase